MGKGGEKVSILGYGCMRFPTKSGRIDEELAEKHLLTAIDQGVNYFDTAYIYHAGKSESFIGKVFSRNNCREQIKIATKLPVYLVHSNNDLARIFFNQLKRLETDYLDYYLMHSINDIESWERLKQLGILEFLEKEKKDGRIRHVGFSYHGSREDFIKLVDDYPWDMCQIQYNYIDVDFQAGIQGLRYAASKGMGVVVMEPLRGGSLVGRMPPEVKKIWDSSGIKRTPAELALRWVWNHPEVSVVLSGMSAIEQVIENIHTAGEAYPNSLDDKEKKLIDDIRKKYLRLMKVGCTGCSYCMPCPFGVDIPKCFSLYNSKMVFKERTARFRYLGFAGGINGRESHAALCKECGKCEKVCPQHIHIREALKDVTRELRIPMSGLLVKAVKGVLKLRSKFKRKAL